MRLIVVAIATQYTINQSDNTLNKKENLMKKILMSVLMICLMASVSYATEFDATKLPVIDNSNKPGVIPESDYSPVLDITFAEYTENFTMGITCDGSYYYDIGYDNYVATYDLNGNLVNNVSIGFTSVRNIFYNPGDGLLYAKSFGVDLYTIDPTNGNTVLVYAGMFQNSNACAALDPNTGLIYEHYNGDIWVYDINTGNMVNSFSLSPYYGYTYPIATNGCHLFTTESDGGTVYVYEMDGTYVETLTGFSGDWGWTLSFCFGENLLFLGDRSGGNWYGYSGVECEDGCCCDVSMDPDQNPVVVEPGGSFGLTGTICNTCDTSIVTDVWWGVQGFGNFYQQGVIQNIYLQPGQCISAHLTQNVPNYAPEGSYDYIAYCGDYNNMICDSFEFTFRISTGGGGPYDVGLVCSDYDNDWSEAHDLLVASSMINSATFVDARDATPSVADLMNYDVVLVWSNYAFYDNVTLGDNLADYVEAGGAVVTAEFSHYSGFELAGRYMTDFSPMGVGTSGYVTSNLVVLDSGHPIMNGVSTGTEYFDFDAPLQGSTYMVQNWDNGFNGTVINTDYPQCVAINDYFGTTYRDWTGDVGQMMVNAVVFAAGNTIGVFNCEVDGDWAALMDEADDNDVFARSNNSVSATESLSRGNGSVPTSTALLSAYPNPFNASTTIPFEIAESANVTLKVYNLAGQVVETLVDGQMDAGQHVATWDASAVASGVYFYKLETGDYSTTRKMNLVK
ncbi:MAG: T9SS type A sorting domain-containing protein [candidate division Zixibacteria bacterium]|nr:T9SS type A sorting domain-containing protein [candidate division Zixibacteria bacterium]